MVNFGIDLRHFNSTQATGKAVYTKRMLDHLIKINKVYAFSNTHNNHITHPNLINVSSFRYLFHFQTTYKVLKNKLLYVATESYITPFLISLFGGRSLIVVHDLISFKDKSHKFFPRLMENIFLPLLIKFKKNTFFFSTESQMKEFHELFKISKKRTFVFFPGTNQITKIPFKKQKKYITFNATFLERKNQILLLKAFNQIKDQIDKTLVLVGKFTNPYISEIQKYIQDHDLNDKVLLKDYVSENELREILSNTAILVNPSKVEGFGLQIIEALNAKIPCLVSDIPVFKEVFKNSCLYFDVSDEQNLADQIIFLNNNLELKKQLLNNAESVLNNYSFKKTLLKFQNLLKKI